MLNVYHFADVMQCIPLYKDTPTISIFYPYNGHILMVRVLLMKAISPALHRRGFPDIKRTRKPELHFLLFIVEVSRISKEPSSQSCISYSSSSRFPESQKNPQA
jgi:hypothetical protein